MVLLKLLMKMLLMLEKMGEKMGETPKLVLLILVLPLVATTRMVSVFCDAYVWCFITYTLGDL